MSTNDGGPTVRVAKQSVPKPEIPRGDLLFPNRPENGLAIGDVTTITYGRVTYHDVEVIDLIGSDPVLRIRPETVATWDDAPGPAPQI